MFVKTPGFVVPLGNKPNQDIYAQLVERVVKRDPQEFAGQPLNGGVYVDGRAVAVVVQGSSGNPAPDLNAYTLRSGSPEAAPSFLYPLPDSIPDNNQRMPPD